MKMDKTEGMRPVGLIAITGYFPYFTCCRQQFTGKITEDWSLLCHLVLLQLKLYLTTQILQMYCIMLLKVAVCVIFFNLVCKTVIHTWHYRILNNVMK